MNLILFDDVLSKPKEYVSHVFASGFQDVYSEDKVFKGIQIRDNDDEFAKFILEYMSDYKVTYNFIRKSPLNQDEPNFKHRDTDMGDVVAILYLNEDAPDGDGTTIYDEDGDASVIVKSKFNRCVMFDANVLHSRNIFENFGADSTSRLIQVVFLKAL